MIKLLQVGAVPFGFTSDMSDSDLPYQRGERLSTLDIHWRHHHLDADVWASHGRAGQEWARAGQVAPTCSSMHSGGGEAGVSQAPPPTCCSVHGGAWRGLLDPPAPTVHNAVVNVAASGSTAGSAQGHPCRLLVEGDLTAGCAAHVSIYRVT
ncbi:hypothetical protein GWK47_009529 [Chionoecetes opilio]|uniref:Uncharacterized protein n=1 Tax=Chionoecetes opilio TaxID=41210 RepID=A0A8J5CPK6_CHIOP|nr:hypothetical protein GWK47_009529 [Chionoecetes opilio]